MDRKKLAALAFAALLVGGAWWWSRRGIAGTSSPASSPDAWLAELDAGLVTVFEDVVSAITPGAWSPPDRAAPYLPELYAQADRIGMPQLMFARQIYQESRFREDIINGTTRSRAGATGIAQLMPATWQAYGIDPTDWRASLRVAADEMRQVYRRFGNWSEALAAYNWGQGNWNSFLRTGLGAKGQVRPQENIDYVADITGDTGYV